MKLLSLQPRLQVSEGTNPPLEVHLHDFLLGVMLCQTNRERTSEAYG